MQERYFSKDYDEARARFIRAAKALGASLYAYPLPSLPEQNLTIDVAIIGPDDVPSLVLSSGVHGVEGFFGSAVQLAVLERIAAEGVPKDIRYVMIHGVNPFGFANLRRFNEDNIDLNRNFLPDRQAYIGAPDGYRALDGFLNPKSPPSRLEPFRVRALWHIWRSGLQTLKEAVAAGQYEFPKGLFFGGKGPSASRQIIEEHCVSWLKDSQKVMHIDFHTGLGLSADYRLLLTEESGAETISWYAGAFGAGHIETMDSGDGTAYDASGVFGEWMKQRFADRDYRFMAAEFGTFSPVEVLASLRAENRAHHYCEKDDPRLAQAKADLLDKFCPPSENWRRTVVEASVKLADQAVTAII